MKKLTIRSLACITFAAFLFSACSENSSSAEPEDTFDAAVVCPADGLNAYGEPNRGTFTDARDGQEYKYVTIGSQVWMAENLKFDAPYNVCKEEGIEGSCDTFGRLYRLYQDGESSGILDRALTDTICPAGWHVPSVVDWTILANSVGGQAYRLISTEMFGFENQRYEPGTDDCGFNSLPEIDTNNDANRTKFLTYRDYWTSTAESLLATYHFAIFVNMGYYVVFRNSSIRCVKNPLD